MNTLYYKNGIFGHLQLLATVFTTTGAEIKFRYLYTLAFQQRNSCELNSSKSTASMDSKS
ncbi:hypothetical protein EVA_06843 [gut metagenome]|uniref:Uncharacterized protein n=1 Tax=gut metagenome TaxID=749906 RepID=J9CXT7_9ZZZZ